MKAIIITIGDEILIGQIVDTNSAWMAQELTSTGFEVIEIITIGDDADQIKRSIDDAFSRADIVLMTGGLGPTKDDITKKTLCEYFDTRLIFDESVLKNIESIITNINVLNELTRNQALVPEGCLVIQNRVGTAPITWFDNDRKVLVSMPGVPYEMKFAMTNEIIPRLQTNFETDLYLKKVFLVVGYPESSLAIHLDNFENNLPLGFALAYLPAPSMVKLRLFVRGENRGKEMEVQAEKLRHLLGTSIIAEEDLSIEKIFGQKLQDKGLTISTAESCTGGNVARLIASVPGASKYFEGSVVSYSNSVKSSNLGVLTETLIKYGAVSKEVVEEMANGVRLKMGTDCSIAISGIAGPDGGTEEKPVGTVWISTICGDRITTKKYQLGAYRDSNIMRATTNAMLQLLEMI